MAIYSPTVSIIVPVYNAEQYLLQCLDSIVSQSNSNWEAILVDDGSTDGSFQICKTFAENDKRFRVFHKTNGGVSSARNYGINHARGEWITFVDADDLIPVDYLPIEFNSRVDLYLTNIKFFPDSINTMRIEPCVIQDNDYQSFIENNARWVVLISVCSKIIRRKIIVDNEISFDTRFSLGEDTLFDLQILRYCRSLIVTDSYYLCRRESANNWLNKYSNRPENTLCYFDTFIGYYKSAGIHAPGLVSNVFCTISNMTDMSQISRIRWAVQPQVLEMKGLMKSILTIKERTKYFTSLFLSILLGAKRVDFKKGRAISAHHG